DDVGKRGLVLARQILVEQFDQLFPGDGLFFGHRRVRHPALLLGRSGETALYCSEFTTGTGSSVDQLSSELNLHKRGHMNVRINSRRSRVVNTGLVLLLCSTLAAAQTRIVPPDNKYPASDDVELGRKAAAEARQQMPILHDDLVSSYVENVGRRLVAAIPSDLQHREFHYTFEVVNVREINAFALPGGPMFVNRGM